MTICRNRGRWLRDAVQIFASFGNRLELRHRERLFAGTRGHADDPRGWVGNALMDEDRRAFYELTTSAPMAAVGWPAAMAFTNGRQIRVPRWTANGLRPALSRSIRRRYMIVMASRSTCASADILKKNRQEVAPATRQDAAARSGAGPHRRRRGSASWPAPSRIDGRIEPRRCRSRIYQSRRLPTNQRIAAGPPTSLWLHGRLKINSAPMVTNGEEPTGSIVATTLPCWCWNKAKPLYN